LGMGPHNSGLSSPIRGRRWGLPADTVATNTLDVRGGCQPYKPRPPFGDPMRKTLLLSTAVLFAVACGALWSVTAEAG